MEMIRERSFREKTTKCKERQKRKFDKLLNRGTGDARARRSKDKWVVNLSSRPLSTAEESVLAKGLNFAPAPRRIPVPDIVAAVEGGLSRIGSAEAQLARTRITGCLAKARPPPTNLSPAEQKAIRSLKQAEDIIITPADKGNATVVMDCTTYDGKIRTFLADADTYKALPRDPTPALERKMNALLLSLTREGAIPTTLYNRLRSSAGKVPLLYGLPKIHKPETPFGQLYPS